MRFNFGILFLLCLVLFALPIQAQEIDLLENEKLKGSVHTIRTELNFYSEIDGKAIMSLDTPWLFIAEVEYDKSQKIINERRRAGCAYERDFRKREKLVLETQIIEFVYGKYGDLEEKIIHTRMSGGKIFRSDHFDKEGGLKNQWMYIYEMDRNGNWVRREAIFKHPDYPSENNILRIVERRIITYY